MPFSSKAQQRFMFAAEARGDLPKGTARRWAHHTDDIKDLPERVEDKKESSVFVPTALEVLAQKAAAANPALGSLVQSVQAKQKAEQLAKGIPQMPTNAERLKNPQAAAPVIRPMALSAAAR